LVVLCVFLKKDKTLLTMKKVVFAVALFAFAGSVSAYALNTVHETKTEKSSDDKKKKKNKKACCTKDGANASTSTGTTGTNGTSATTGTTTTSTTSGKSCCSSKATTGGSCQGGATKTEEKKAE
jgi:hypothetical protein